MDPFGISNFFSASDIEIKARLILDMHNQAKGTLVISNKNIIMCFKKTLIRVFKLPTVSAQIRSISWFKLNNVLQTWLAKISYYYETWMEPIKNYLRSWQ